MRAGCTPCRSLTTAVTTALVNCDGWGLQLVFALFQRTDCPANVRPDPLTGPSMFESAPADADPAATARIAGHGRILASAAMLGTTVVLVKLLAFGKDWLVARRFGASDELDAFLVALVIPSYAVAVLAHSFGLAFVPTYIRVLQDQGGRAAARLTAGALVGGCAVLLGSTLVLVAVSPYVLPLIGTGFDEPKLALAGTLFNIVVGILVASGISSILGAVLNAQERFATTALAPMAVPACTVVVFWLGQNRYGVYALAVGTTLGFILECLILSVAVHRRRLLRLRGWNLFEASLKRVGSQYVPVAVGALLMSSSLVVDQAMAASLGSGSVSVLSYANKIPALVLGIVAVSLSTVLFPRFSRLIANGQWDELERTIGGYSKAIFMLSIPGVALLALGSEPLVRLIFERGAFSPQTTAAVSEVQLWLLPQIPFYVLAMLGARLLSALGGNHIVLGIGALNLAMNVGGNLLFMHWFGVKGIAMSTSLMYLVATLATLAAIRLKLADERPRAD
jgi:putative peptidoglycan lipid II flippase